MTSKKYEAEERHEQRRFLATIEAYMQAKKVSKLALAEMVNVNYRYLVDILNRKKPASWETITGICSKLKINLNYIATGEGSVYTLHNHIVNDEEAHYQTKIEKLENELQEKNIIIKGLMNSIKASEKSDRKSAGKSASKYKTQKRR